MTGLLYQLILLLSGRFGLWVFYIYAWIVAAGFFFLFPARAAAGVRFYRALYPGRTGFCHILCTWRQYQHFTTVFLDRYLLHAGCGISRTSEGWHFLEDAVRKGSGGIILMSHMGNWEMAAHLLRQENMPLLLYMGKKHKEQIEKMQKESLMHSGVHILAADEDEQSPFALVEGLRFLRSGGLVSMTGDILWQENQKYVTVSFLNHEIRVPETPHMLALVSGAPIFIFFAFRTGHCCYHFSVTEPLYVRSASREERKEAVRRSAQHYASLLEKALRKYPCQWYHFRPFLF
ncbi:MAG: lysophospholipid acyltransferase family protein [Desulfobacterales bacterium]